MSKVEMQKKMYTPFFDKVWLRLIDLSDRTASGLFLPSHNEKVQEAEVVACGEGLIMEDGSMKPLPVKPGDIVLVVRGAGVIVKAKADGTASEVLLRIQDLIAKVDTADA